MNIQSWFNRRFTCGFRYPSTSLSKNIARRYASTILRSPLAFAFDIDGVLLQGSTVIPCAKHTLEILNGHNSHGITIPFILMTNGGGYAEEDRCRRLSSQLGVDISTSQLIQAHTILRERAQKRPDENVLVLGGTKDRVRKVAEGYGFKNVYIPSDILAWNPHIWPFYTLSDEELTIVKKGDFSNIPFSSILVFHDPRNWSMDIQIMIDILRSRTRCAGAPYGPLSDTGSKPVEVVFCNPDLLWRGALKQPRLGQGSFIQAFQAVYKSLTGEAYPFIQYGKPCKATYRFAERMLLNHIARLENCKPEEIQLPEVYMIGDNPSSDIAGANAAKWSSVLVRTGVYDSSAGPPAHQPAHETEDVGKAVEWALRRHGIGSP